MLVSQKNALNIRPGTAAQLVVHVSQGDTGSDLEFYLYNGSDPYEPDGVAIALEGMRKTGTGVGPIACTYVGNLVTVQTTAEMTAEAGPVLCELIITDGSGESIGTANFAILVEEATFPDGPLYNNSVDVYSQILAYVQTIPASVDESVNARIAVETAAREAADTVMQTDIANLQSGLASETSARTAADALLQTEIDNIIAPSGEAPSAAEVQNARIGADGTVYDTLGNAIRGQVTDLKSALKDSGLIYMPELTWTNGYYYNITSGDLSEYAPASYSQKLDISGFNHIYIKVNGYGDLRGACFYDANEEFIQDASIAYDSGLNEYNLPIPESAKYVGLTGPIVKCFLYRNNDADIETLVNRVDGIENELQDTPELTWTPGYYYNTTSGSTSPLSGSAISQMLETKGNKKAYLYVRGYGDIRGVCYYDKNKRFISGVAYASGYNTYNLVFPDNCYYIGITKPETDNNIIFKFVDIPQSALDLAAYNATGPASAVTMFEKVGCCGDSYTKGQIYNSGGTSLGFFEKSSWGKILERLYNVSSTIYAYGGVDTNTFQQNPDCLPKLLASDPEQLYLLCLGINDADLVDLGTIADITEDYTQNPNTFYGNYGKIIEQIMNHAPNAKLIIFKSFLPVGANGNKTTYYNYSSKAVEEIAAKYNIPYIETYGNKFFSSDGYIKGKQGAHPTAPLYAGMGKAIGEMVGECILQYYSYFNSFMLT